MVGYDLLNAVPCDRRLFKVIYKPRGKSHKYRKCAKMDAAELQEHIYLLKFCNGSFPGHGAL